jgi:Putative  PD-(D/E)XK family member, (DUF4420)
MAGALFDIFASLSPVPAAQSERPAYGVGAVPGKAGYLVGKDREGAACLLISGAGRGLRKRAPIRLENLEVAFGLDCIVRQGSRSSEDVFTVIRCRNDQNSVVRYFFSVGEAVIGMLGDSPTETAIATAVNRLAQIFQRLQKPAGQAVTGLLGELIFIRESSAPRRMVAAWRAVETSRFDFSSGDVRIDVKAATGRIRSHVFAYDQCNPPPGTVALAASLFIEQASGGTALRDVLGAIEARAGGDAGYLLKLHEIVADTLGSGLSEAMTYRFDERLAVSSLQLFDLRMIPGLRGTLPPGVSDVHFRADLSACTPTSKHELAAAHPVSAAFLELLP